MLLGESVGTAWRSVWSDTACVLPARRSPICVLLVRRGCLRQRCFEPRAVAHTAIDTRPEEVEQGALGSLPVLLLLALR